jgi:hypothetical protein
MPITQATLSTKIKSEMQAVYGAPDEPEKLQKFADAIAKAIVDEITSSALVTGTVTSGAGAGGSVTGTIS